MMYFTGCCVYQPLNPEEAVFHRSTDEVEFFEYSVLPESQELEKLFSGSPSSRSRRSSQAVQPKNFPATEEEVILDPLQLDDAPCSALCPSGVPSPSATRCETVAPQGICNGSWKDGAVVQISHAAFEIAELRYPVKPTGACETEAAHGELASPARVPGIEKSMLPDLESEATILSQVSRGEGIDSANSRCTSFEAEPRGYGQKIREKVTERHADDCLASSRSDTTKASIGDSRFSEDSHSEFPPGVVVALRHLRSSPHLNGTLCTCEGWDDARAMVVVRLSTGKRKLVKPSNVYVVEPLVDDFSGSGSEKGQEAEEAPEDVNHLNAETSELQYLADLLNNKAQERHAKAVDRSWACLSRGSRHSWPVRRVAGKSATRGDASCTSEKVGAIRIVEQTTSLIESEDYEPSEELLGA